MTTCLPHWYYTYYNFWVVKYNRDKNYVTVVILLAIASTRLPPNSCRRIMIDVSKMDFSKFCSKLNEAFLSYFTFYQNAFLLIQMFTSWRNILRIIHLTTKRKKPFLDKLILLNIETLSLAELL